MSADAAPRLSAEVAEYAIGNRRILHTAYVDAVPGTVTALIGVSGSGKTTLFEIMVGRRRAWAQVRWEDQFVPRPRFATLARMGLFYLPDRPWLARPLSVARHLRAAARPGVADWRSIAAELEIDDLLDKKVEALSGGESRLVELALALAVGGRTLVADEPFKGLDPRRREIVAREFRSLAERGVAVLFADHDVSSIRMAADRMFAMEDGRTRLVPDFRGDSTQAWYHLWPDR